MGELVQINLRAGADQKQRWEAYVEMTVDDGPSETFDWEDPDVSLAPLHVLVDESQNIKFLLQAG